MAARKIRGVPNGSVGAIFLFGGEDNSPVAFPILPTPNRWQYCTRYDSGFAATEKMQRLGMDSAQIAGNLAIRDDLVKVVYTELPRAPQIEAERQKLADSLNFVMDASGQLTNRGNIDILFRL